MTHTTASTVRMKRKHLARFLIALTAVVTTTTGAVHEVAPRHLQLLKSEPAEDAALAAAPDSIRLWFSEAPEIRVTTVKVARPDGTVRSLEGVRAAKDDSKLVIAPFGEPGGPGAYEVNWRTMSKDGHVVSGEFAFRIETPH